MDTFADSLIVQAAALEERDVAETEIDPDIDLILEDVSESVPSSKGGAEQFSSTESQEERFEDAAEEIVDKVGEDVVVNEIAEDVNTRQSESVEKSAAVESDKNFTQNTAADEGDLSASVVERSEMGKNSRQLEDASVLEIEVSKDTDVSKENTLNTESIQKSEEPENAEDTLDKLGRSHISNPSAMERKSVSQAESQSFSERDYSRSAKTELREDAIVRAIRVARPAVVNIRGEKLMKTVPYDASGADPQKQSNPQSESPHVNGMGTGVIFDSRGYIATNFHVVDGIQEIHVTTADSKTYVARIIARDRETDLAIIKIEALAGEVFETIPIGESSDLMTGETVIAVGNAYGYEHTVTRGIVSALHRAVQVSDVQYYQDLIQTDASINPGNSGGPLLNIKGEMIGINVAVRAGAQGIGFAIPVNRAMEIIARMVESCSSSQNWHGIGFANHPIGSSHGAVVESVEKNSPAESIGLRVGDVILGVNQRKIANRLDFACSILEMKSGETIRISVARNQKTATVKLAMGAVAAQNRGRTDYAPEIADKSAFHVEKLTNEEIIWKQMGIFVSPVRGNEILIHGSRKYNGGLLVQNVRPNSPAARQGIQNGDVLLGILQWETLTLDNVIFILGHPEFQNRQNVKFLLAREGQVFRGSFAVGDFKNNSVAETASATYPAAR